MAIKVLTPFNRDPYTPKDRTPACEHNVQLTGYNDSEWRKRKYGDHTWQKCTFPAVVEVDGRPMCRRHAGQTVLDQYVNGDIVRKDGK